MTVTGRAVRSTLSVVSCAVYFTDSAVVSLTVKVAIPLLFVVALVAVTFEAPPAAVSVTAFPVTGIPAAVIEQDGDRGRVGPVGGHAAGVGDDGAVRGTGGGAGGLPNVTTPSAAMTAFPSVTSVA